MTQTKFEHKLIRMRPQMMRVAMDFFHNEEDAKGCCPYPNSHQSYKMEMMCELLDEVTQQTIAEEKNEEHLYYTSR